MTTGDNVIYKDRGYVLDSQEMILKELVLDEENKLVYTGNRVNIKNLKECRLANDSELMAYCNFTPVKEVVTDEPTGTNEKVTRVGRKPNK